MASDYRPLDDEEIIQKVNQLSGEAVSYHDSELSEEREAVLKYYDAEAPKRSGRNNSSYVSQDVYDSVENAQAAIAEVFAGDQSIGEFMPQTADDVQQAEQATRYCDHIIFRKNDGFSIVQTAIRDGLMNRNAIGKVYWHEEEIVEEEEFEGLTEGQLLVLLEDDEIDEIAELSQDEDTLLFDGVFIRKMTVAYPCIENVAPEEFGISPRARSMEDAPIIFHRQKKTAGELRAMGLSDDEIEKARGSARNEIGETDAEVEARYENIDESTSHFDNPVQKQGEPVWVFESYIMLDIDGDGVQKRWKITHAGSVLIDKEPASRLPFLTFCPVPRPHSFWGSNWADRIIPTQNAKTTLTRGILDHTVATNRPRYEVLKGTLKSAKELMDDRFGGIVNVNRQEGIKPFDQAPLNPFTFQTIQLLQDDLEDTTGVSSLATGLNKDAVSKQNSADLVGQLTTLSQQRAKIMARNFANQWVKKMYELVYLLAIEYDDKETILQINGSYVPVNPTTWRKRENFQIDPHVGYGEREKEAQKWLEVDALLTQSAPSQYGPQQKFRVLSKSLRAMGVKDVENYVNPSPPPPQPDPFALAEMQLREREMSLKEQEFQLKVAQADRDGQFDLEKLRLDQQKQRAEFALKSDAQDLKEEQHAHAAEVARRELAILERAGVETRGIASPNS